MAMDFLRSSKKGTSRFSKALPVPPPPPTEPVSSIPSPPPFNTRAKQLPSIPPIQSPTRRPVMSDKPLPPPQPLNQSLPPLPPLQTKELPRMRIARRPVAKPAAPPQSQPQQQQPEEQHSPTGSIGSILSAYSRSSGESLMRSPDGTASQRDSAPTYTSEQYGTREQKMTPNSFSSGDNEASYTHFAGTNNLAQKFTSDKGLPPAPAYEDEQAPPPPAKPGHEATGGSPTSFGSSSSPQRSIWRRRSVKSDRNIEVPDLKLAVSHGSTAESTTPNTAAQPAIPAIPPQPKQQYPPRTTSGLPGRNIRPIHHPEYKEPKPVAAPPAAANEMGQKPSSLTNKISHLRGEEGANVGVSHSDTALSPTKRLPTPDYEKEDVKTPVVETVVSPISPASSPEPAAAQGQAPAAEAKSPIPRKAVTARNLHNAQSLPQMRVDEPVTNNEAPPTVTRDFAVSPASPETQGQFPARTTSNQQRAGPAQWQQQQQQLAPSPAFPPQQQQQQYQQYPQQGHLRSPSTASRDPRHQEPVVYRELRQNDLPPADPRASYFPIHTLEPPSPSIIYNSLPLKDSMLDCYVKHRVMDRTRNRNYALTCQTCGKADTEDRYKCQWCYVRMCASCLRVFNNERRDLRKLLAHLEEQAQNQPNGESHEEPAEAAVVDEQQHRHPAKERPIDQQQQPQMVAA